MSSPIDSLVVDLSNYDWDTFDAKAFYAYGIRRAIVGTQQPSITDAMIPALRSEGIEVIALYELPYFGTDWTTQPQMERLVAACEKHKVNLAFLDAEIDANQTNVPEWQGIPTPSVAQRQAEFRWGMNLARANVQTVGVYTNGGWWKPNMGNSTEWADARLWLATYGVGGSAIGPIETVNFGGWTAPLLHQYTSTAVINNRVRDLSYLFGSVAVEDELAQADIDRITALEALVKDLSWAVFSGNEDRANSDAQRAADVAYRIDQRLGRASDGTKMNSVSDNAWVAIKGFQAMAAATGMTPDQVRAIVGDEIADMLDAAKAVLPQGASKQ